MEKFNLNLFLDNLEKNLIVIALSEHKQNCAKAARSLGIERTALVMKRKKYGLKLRAPTSRGNTRK